MNIRHYCLIVSIVLLNFKFGQDVGNYRTITSHLWIADTLLPFEKTQIRVWPIVENLGQILHCSTFCREGWGDFSVLSSSAGDYTVDSRPLHRLVEKFNIKPWPSDIPTGLAKKPDHF